MSFPPEITTEIPLISSYDSISSLDEYSSALLVESALAFPDASDEGGSAEV